MDAGWDPLWMTGLVAYADARDVGLILWKKYDEVVTDIEREAFLQQIQNWGVKGVKIDFVLSDRQSVIKWYDETIQDCADHEIMVNFHGATLPRGQSRRWPHVMTHEAVLGAEFYKIRPTIPVSHNCTLPFTRNVVGSMDYTPVTFSATNNETTLAHELALSVVFESGWQHFADSFESYNSYPLAKEWLQFVSAAWDQTEFLDGYPGDVVCMARRKGAEWFLGALNAGDATNISVSLDFLGAQAYDLAVYHDAGPSNLVKSTSVVSNTSDLVIGLTNNGGYCARFTLRTADIENPAQVSNLVVVSSSVRAVKLAWHASSDNQGVAQYSLYRDGMPLGELTGTSFVDCALSPDTSYAYTVAVVDYSGNTSIPSSVLYALTAAPQTAAPSKPVGISIWLEDYTTVWLTWPESYDDEGVEAYLIERDGVCVATNDVPAYMDPDLNENVTYTYRIAALDGEGNQSVWSEPVSISTEWNIEKAPFPWVVQDIGSPGIEGDATFINNSFVLKGSGANIWNPSDSFVYTYLPLQGDGTIQARLHSFPLHGENFASAGLMIRQTLSGNSAHAYMHVNPQPYGAKFMFRPTNGGIASQVELANGATAPCWLRLTRSGNTFTAFYSVDGSSWQQVGSQTMTMSTNVYAGLAVCAHNNGLVSTAVFDHVTFTGVDTDADDLDDSWESWYFADLAAGDGAGDYDGDGFTDKQEYLAGSDPTNAASFLYVLDAEMQAGSESMNVELSWPSGWNRLYTVQASPNGVVFTNAASGISGTPPANTVTIGRQDEKSWFRVIVHE